MVGQRPDLEVCVTPAGTGPLKFDETVKPLNVPVAGAAECGDGGIEVHEPAVNFRGRAEYFIAQTRVQSQARCDLDVVLKERREVGVALVFAEISRASAAHRDVADAVGAAILRSALTEKKVVEGANIEKSAGRERRIDHDFMPLHLGAGANGLPAFSQRNRVLPDEGVSCLLLERSACVADCEETVHGDPCSFDSRTRNPGGRFGANV